VHRLLPRAVRPRLAPIVAVVLLLGGALPVAPGRAQDSGAASFTVASASGTVVIRRADGSTETARPGTELFANDQLASVGRSEAMLNAAGPGATSGASLLLYADTTVGVRDPGAGAGTFYVADLAQGVVLARTPTASGATLQVTNEAAGAVAQVNPGGGMAVASDVGTGTIAVSCEDRASQVFFPYTDARVPCERGVVRTLSNQRTIEDDTADSGSAISAAVQAAGTNPGAAQSRDTGQGSLSQQQRSREQERDDPPQPQAPASPAATATVPTTTVTPTPTVTPTATPTTQPCNTATNSGGQGVTTTSYQLGRSSGTFSFSYNAFSQPDQFDILYEGRTIFSTGGPVSGSNTVAVSYSGSSTQITVRVTGPSAGTEWEYTVSCPS
jgi:hypothetical protein